MKPRTIILALTLIGSLAFISCSKTKSEGKLAIAFLPKSKGNQYFVTCERGARAAATELNAELKFDGPTNPDPAKQNEIVENWITDGVNVIVAACENKDSISTALRKAQAAGIKVITYDADSQPDARSFFVNQATAQAIGEQLMDTAASLTGSEGEFAIITGSLTSSNMNEWIKYIKERQAKYPNMKLVDIKPCDDQKDKAQQEATNLLSAYPNLKAIIAASSLAVPGAAEAVKLLLCWSEGLHQEFRRFRRSHRMHPIDRSHHDMKPHATRNELKVGTTRHFTQPAADVESDAELDPAREDVQPAEDGSSLSVPTTSEPKDI